MNTLSTIVRLMLSIFITLSLTNFMPRVDVFLLRAQFALHLWCTLHERTSFANNRDIYVCLDLFRSYTISMCATHNQSNWTQREREVRCWRACLSRTLTHTLSAVALNAYPQWSLETNVFELITVFNILHSIVKGFILQEVLLNHIGNIRFEI